MDQLAIDFSNLNHNENNFDSQMHFEANKDHFSAQCKKVYQALMRGERLTTRKALVDYGIGDLRRRVKDLKDQWQVPIEADFAKDENGNPTRYKEYYLPKSN